ncbi:hypothetical protein NUW58_g369 [Xylaria curta]|uniref:Uncharacterized protein n=1 Tax=Xylaria curta TaxID=42375 RepID=A0ACC1PPJ3_9PEZI|nr:hypothetical protein NUW58_g369 [Xylaria curta]
MDVQLNLSNDGYKFSHGGRTHIPEEFRGRIISNMYVEFLQTNKSYISVEIRNAAKNHAVLHDFTFPIYGFKGASIGLLPNVATQGTVLHDGRTYQPAQLFVKTVRYQGAHQRTARTYQIDFLPDITLDALLHLIEGNSLQFFSFVELDVNKFFGCRDFITDLGAKLVSKIFSALDNTVRKYADYRERKSDKGCCLFQLKEDTNVSEYNLAERNRWGLPLRTFRVPCRGESLGLLVHRADVKLLSENEPYLNDENGTHFPCDAILCETRWESRFEMFENSTLLELGLPYPKNIEPQKETAKWDKLVGNADEQILKRFVMLGNPLKYYYKYETRTPYRLYRTIAPLHDDPILLMNHIVAGAKLFAAEAQAIWAVACWDNAFKLPSGRERK